MEASLRTARNPAPNHMSHTDGHRRYRVKRTAGGWLARLSGHGAEPINVVIASKIGNLFEFFTGVLYAAVLW
jgi:hypothetical protein